MKLPAFNTLVQNYPTGDDPDAVRAAIGGEVAGMPRGSNTCVIRMSKALNEAGKEFEISNGAGSKAKLYTLKGADHKNYALRVAEFLPYLRQQYGPPTVSVRYKTPAEVESVNPFRAKKGIIAWHVRGWTDATGHFTLWDGANGLYEGGEDYFSPKWFPKKVRTSTGMTTIWETGIDLWVC